MQKQKYFFYTTILTVLFAISIFSTVLAGSDNEYGQLTGIPVTANYTAWLSKAGTPPSQVLTEDSYNPELGTDQGYQAGLWLLSAGNFNNPSAASGDGISIIFGGLGTDTGKLWTDSNTWVTDDPSTDWGTAPLTASSGGECPVMLQGSWDLGQNEKVVNWSGPAGTYLIYRSQNESGAYNGASNGRYLYADTVTTVTSSGTWTDTNADIETWHIVIPADASENIIGCHSEESNPTAISLLNFAAATSRQGVWPWLLLVGTLVVTGGLAWIKRSKA